MPHTTHAAGASFCCIATPSCSADPFHPLCRTTSDQTRHYLCRRDLTISISGAGIVERTKNRFVSSHTEYLPPFSITPQYVPPTRNTTSGVLSALKRLKISRLGHDHQSLHLFTSMSHLPTPFHLPIDQLHGTRARLTVSNHRPISFPLQHTDLHINRAVRPSCIAWHR